MKRSGSTSSKARGYGRRWLCPPPWHAWQLSSTHQEYVPAQRALLCPRTALPRAPLRNIVALRRRVASPPRCELCSLESATGVWTADSAPDPGIAPGNTRELDGAAADTCGGGGRCSSGPRLRRVHRHGRRHFRHPREPKSQRARGRRGARARNRRPGRQSKVCTRWQRELGHIARVRSDGLSGSVMDVGGDCRTRTVGQTHGHRRRAPIRE